MQASALGALLARFIHPVWILPKRVKKGLKEHYTQQAHELRELSPRGINGRLPITSPERLVGGGGR